MAPGWQATFLAILPAAIALWFIIARFMQIGNPISKASTTIDIKGTLALAATIITFLAAITLIEGNSYGEMYQVGGLFTASGVSLAAFIVIERRAYLPLLDFRLMMSKTFLAPTIIPTLYLKIKCLGN